MSERKFVRAQDEWTPAQTAHLYRTCRKVIRKQARELGTYGVIGLSASVTEWAIENGQTDVLEANLVAHLDEIRKRRRSMS